MGRRKKSKSKVGKATGRRAKAQRSGVRGPRTSRARGKFGDPLRWWSALQLEDVADFIRTAKGPSRVGAGTDIPDFFSLVVWHRRRAEGQLREEMDRWRIPSLQLTGAARTCARIVYHMDSIALANLPEPIHGRTKREVAAHAFHRLAGVAKDLTELDVWYRGGSALYLAMRADKSVEVVERAELEDPELVIGHLTGGVVDVAFDLAYARRAELCQSLEPPRADGTRLGSEEMRDHTSAIHAWVVSREETPPEIPDDLIARRIVQVFGAPPRRKHVLTDLENARLESGFRRTWLRLNPMPADSFPARPDRGKSQARHLTPGERRVWDVLAGRTLTADVIARHPEVDSSAPAVREHIGNIRVKLGPSSIQNRRPYGYFRPDSPPDWDSVPLPPRRRNRPT